MSRLLYRFLAQFARIAVRSGRWKDLQIIVLRHENAVLRRQVGRPSLTDDDRTLLGAIAAALPKALRHGWIVTPETLLRWHRKRIAKHWTQPPVPLEYWRVCADQRLCPPSWPLVSRLLYRFLAQFAGLAVRSGRWKDLQIIVLRHENAVLRRQVGRPALNDDDRTLLGAVAAALPKALRQGWIATPETLLRWHRKRIANHWTQPPTRRAGRPLNLPEMHRTRWETVSGSTLQRVKPQMRELLCGQFASQKDGSDRSAANSSTARSFGTNSSSNASFATTFSTSTSIDPTSRSTNDHRHPSTNRQRCPHPPSPCFEPADATDSYTSTEMPPDGGHPVSGRHRLSVGSGRSQDLDQPMWRPPIHKLCNSPSVG